MKILAFDTTSKTAAVAITENEKPIGFTVIDTLNTHSVTLLPMTDDLMKRSGVDIKDIDLFVCSAGPGSFTGVRIGTSTVKGLAFAENKPCIGVSSLEALAMNVFAENGIICPVMDARRGQLYNALFKANGYGTIERLTEDRTVTVDELCQELKEMSEKVFLTGDGYDIAYKALTGLNCQPVPENMRYHNAYNVAVLGYRKYIGSDENMRLRFNATALSPVYLRASQAERERLERENKTI